MSDNQPASQVGHHMRTWRSLLAWLGLGRHIAVCGADLDAEQPDLPDCPDCVARLRRV